MNENLAKVFNKKNLNIAKKVIFTLITLLMVYVFFATDNISVNTKTDKIIWGRATVVFLLCVLELVIIYVKDMIPEKISKTITVVLWGFSNIGLYMLLEYSQGFEIFRLRKLDLFFNVFIIFAINALFYLISNSFRVSMALTSISVCVFGLGEYYILQFRGTGLLASDLYNIGTAMNVADNYEYSLNYGCFILLFATIIICTLATRMKAYTPFKKVKRLIPAVLCCIVIFICSFEVVGTSRHDVEWKVKMFKPQVSYERHGSILMFMHSFRYNIIEVPENYSVKEVENIAKKYPGEKVDNEKKPNIIVIMDEAFSDLEKIGEVELSEDCMPFFHSLKENTIKGNLFVSVCAGGTANTEFEALTSNTLAFAPLKSSPYQIYINDPMPSLTTTLSQQGYGGLLAMHPYKGNGYKRDKVYPLLGFDKFLTKDDFTKPKLVRNHISDEEDFNRIISEYEAHKQNSNSPFYMFNVTMQNHSDYNKEWDNLSKEITVSGKNKNSRTPIYVNLIKTTDDALKMLVEYFEKQSEPTMIVFFGDHQARLGKKFYKKLLETSPLDEEYKSLRNYFTQYMIWANFDIQEQEDVWTSPNYLTSMILDTAGLSKSGYQSFVSKVREQVPVITQLGYIGKDGKFYKNGDKKSPYYNILNEYHILEYNNLFDSKNRIDNFFEVGK